MKITITPFLCKLCEGSAVRLVTLLFGEINVVEQRLYIKARAADDDRNFPRLRARG